MKFIKSEDGEQITAVKETGEVVAYIRKNRFGTHGHWRGWRHYTYCWYLNEIIWAGVSCDVVYPDWKWGSGHGWSSTWTDAPMVFTNTSDFKKYYS